MQLSICDKNKTELRNGQLAPFMSQLILPTALMDRRPAQYARYTHIAITQIGPGGASKGRTSREGLA